jgi:hypothetical protein
MKTDLMTFGDLTLVKRFSFDPHFAETRTWSKIQANKSPKPRSSHTAVVSKNFMLIFGGRHGDDVLSDTWAYDFGKVIYFSNLHLDTKVWFVIETTGTPPCGLFKNQMDNFYQEEALTVLLFFVTVSTYLEDVHLGAVQATWMISTN